MRTMIAVLALVSAVSCGGGGPDVVTTSTGEQPDAAASTQAGQADVAAPTTGGGPNLPNVAAFGGTAVVLLESGSGEMIRYDFSTEGSCAISLDPRLVQVSMGDLIKDNFSLTQIDEQTVSVHVNVDGIAWEAWTEVDGYLTVTETTATWVGDISGGESGNEEVLGSVEVFCGTG